MRAGTIHAMSRPQGGSHNAVFVVDTNDRVVDRIVFANPTDAKGFIDVLSFYRARRLHGGSAKVAAPEPQ